MPKRHNAGGCKCCVTCTLNVKVLDCNGNLFSGQTVTIKNVGTGATVATLVTDGTGTVTYNVTTNATYSATVSPSRYQSKTASAVVTCPANANITLSPLVASGFTCCPGDSYPYNNNFTITDASGTRALTWSTFRGGAWFSTCFLFNGAAVFHQMVCGGSVSLQWIFAVDRPAGSNLCSDVFAFGCPPSMGFNCMVNDAAATSSFTPPDPPTGMLGHGSGTYAAGAASLACPGSCPTQHTNSPITGTYALTE